MSLPVKLFTLTLLLFLQFAETSLAADTEAPKVKELIDAEKQEKVQVAATRAIPADQYDRGTPRTSITALSEALGSRNYELAMNYLDMRNLPGSIRRQGQEIARQLKIIADRSLWVDIDTISNDPHGHTDDGLPDNRDIIARVKTPDGPVNILMQRLPDGQGGNVWKLSYRTVAEIPNLYEHYGYGEYGDKLSRDFSRLPGPGSGNMAMGHVASYYSARVSRKLGTDIRL